MREDRVGVLTLGERRPGKWLCLKRFAFSAVDGLAITQL
jgi:hypothetical protein